MLIAITDHVYPCYPVIHQYRGFDPSSIGGIVMASRDIKDVFDACWSETTKPLGLANFSLSYYAVAVQRLKDLCFWGTGRALFRPQWTFYDDWVDMEKKKKKKINSTIGITPGDVWDFTDSELVIFYEIPQVKKVQQVSQTHLSCQVQFHLDGSALAVSPDDLALPDELQNSTKSFAVVSRTKYQLRKKVVYALNLVLSDEDYSKFSAERYDSIFLIQKSPELQKILGICVDK